MKKPTPLPPEIKLLEGREIHPGDAFVIHGETPRYCLLTSSLKILELNGEEIHFSENDIWERYEKIEKIELSRFQRARQAFLEQLWQERGKPGPEDISALSDRFLSAWSGDTDGTDWGFLCRYDEETIRRVLDEAADRLTPGKEKQATFRKMFRAVVTRKAIGRR